MMDWSTNPPITEYLSGCAFKEGCNCQIRACRLIIINSHIYFDDYLKILKFLYLRPLYFFIFNVFNTVIAVILSKSKKRPTRHQRWGYWTKAVVQKKCIYFFSSSVEPSWIGVLKGKIRCFIKLLFFLQFDTCVLQKAMWLRKQGVWASGFSSWSLEQYIEV